jgi:hypothetical protein
MGAISMNLSAIFMPGGPMLHGNWGGTVLGSGSDSWKYWAELHAGGITPRDWDEIEQGIARSPGHCMTMGTASTMTGAVEALGMTLPGASSIPAPDSRHAVMATLTPPCGAGIVCRRPAGAGSGRRHRRARHSRPPPDLAGHGRGARAPSCSLDPTAAPYPRGYGAMFAQHITRANEGCDFDYLERGAPIPDPEIH